MLRAITTSFFLLIISTLSFAQEVQKWGDWHFWGEQADGTYRNPIIPSDYSDIDCIRVGDDYYAISSTFQFLPGMTILHSRDLVNWEICGHAINDVSQIGEELNWTGMSRYGRGVWAGTIRYYQGRFYVFFGTPDEGYFMTSAPSIEGPWDPLTCIMSEAGWDDCTVMWDETSGKSVFVGTCFKDGYKTYMFEMSPDGKSFDKSTALLLNEGAGREANKLIKYGDWYYLIYSEHHGKGRYVMAKRSKELWGPYDEVKQLALPSTEANEPNQGGIVQGKDGKWYFLTHHGRGDWSGRIVSLLTVTWTDGWPIIGEVMPDNVGKMQWSAPMPVLLDEKAQIQRSDDFNSAAISPQWQWNYQPREGFYSMTERQGWLTLKAFRPLDNDNLMKAGNTLTQRVFRNESNVVTIKMDISMMTDGQKSGLCHFSSKHSAIGVVRRGGRNYLEYRQNGALTSGPELHADIIYFRSVWGLDGQSQYSYSLDGETFIDFGDSYELVWGHYRGDRIGIYCFNNKADSGRVHIDYLHYTE